MRQQTWADIIPRWGNDDSRLFYEQVSGPANGFFWRFETSKRNGSLISPRASRLHEGEPCLPCPLSGTLVAAPRVRREITQVLTTISRPWRREVEKTRTRVECILVSISGS